MPKKPSKGKSSPLADYIRPAVDAKYRKRSKAAKDIGIDEGVLSKICAGKRPGVSDKIIEKLCGKLGLDKKEGILRLFLTNHRNMRKYFIKPQKPISFRILHANQNGKAINPEKTSSAYTPVPLVDIKEFTQGISLTKQAKEHVLVPNELAPKDGVISCCKIKGNSMAPTLPEGSIVAIDSEIRKPQHGKLFSLNWEKKVVVRRILIKDKYILFCPENSDQEKYPIEVCAVKKVKSGKQNIILGKVVWSMGAP